MYNIALSNFFQELELLIFLALSNAKTRLLDVKAASIKREDIESGFISVLEKQSNVLSNATRHVTVKNIKMLYAIIWLNWRFMCNKSTHVAEKDVITLEGSHLSAVLNEKKQTPELCYRLQVNTLLRPEEH